MNLIQWLFFAGTVLVSIGFTLYERWVFWRYAKPSYRTVITGCEIARYILDQAGLVHISISPVDPEGMPLSMDDLFLSPKVYEGRDFLSIIQAARQAFLKSQLSNLTFWIRLKKRLAFVLGFTVMTGWIFLILGIFVPFFHFLIHFGLGCFVVVMSIAVLDLPFELEIKDRISILLKRSGHFQQNEYQCLKKINQARAMEGLSAIMLAPFNQFRYLLSRTGKNDGI